MYPSYNVILKCTFDDLVQKIRGQKLMDVGSRKSLRKWLRVY